MARSVYATISDLRSKAGLSDTTQYPDDRLLELLELSAEIIESLTQQFFGPKRLTLRIDGLGRHMVEEANKNKIIEIESVAILSPAGDSYILDPEYYVVDDRAVRLRKLDRNPSPYERAFQAWPEHRFIYDYQNVEVTGVFGWLSLDTKFETTLTTALARAGTSFQLAAPGDISVNDVLLIDSTFWVIVSAITPAGLVTIDPSPKAAGTGASVVRYGKVPLLLRESAIRVVIVNQNVPGSEEELEGQYADRIRREQTDNYEVEFYQSPSGSKVTAGTGDPIADAYLSRFRAPSISGSWV